MADDLHGRLNSATKYPSIPTYHVIDSRTGKLTADGPEHSWQGTVALTEKVDGTSGRIVVMPDGDWYIGSREEILTARGDRIENPALGIVSALRETAARLGEVERPFSARTGTAWAFYFEVYGYRIGPAARQYTRDGQVVGARLFDIGGIPLDVLETPRAEIASWRDRGGQGFLSETQLQRAAQDSGLLLTPRIASVNAAELPADILSTAHWLEEMLPESLAKLDDSAGGRPEGIVLRTQDRSVIAKARFADYERTLSGAHTRKSRPRG